MNIMLKLSDVSFEGICYMRNSTNEYSYLCNIAEIYGEDKKYLLNDAYKRAVKDAIRDQVLEDGKRYCGLKPIALL